MTIRRRLVLMSVAAFVAVLLAAGAGAVSLLRNRLLDDLDSTLIERRNAIEAFTAGVPFDMLVPRANERPQFVGSDIAVIMLDSADRIVVTLPSGPPEDPDPLPDLSASDIERLRTDDDPFTIGRGSDGDRLVAASIMDGEVLLVLAQPLDEVGATLRTTSLILLGVGITAAVLLGGAIWLVIRRELRPLDTMAGTADRITEGELSQRVPVETHANEVGRLGGALNSMLERIEEAVDAKTESEDTMRRFVADAAHELRTPLTSIRGYAELYRTGATTPDHVQRSFERIEHEAARMGGLVEDLVLLARLDQERPFTPTRIDMAEVARDAVADARAVEPDRPLTIDLASDQTTVDGDLDRLRQVVANLLGNVRTHTEPDTPAVVTVRRKGAWVVVTVRDEGEGMAPADAAQAFERFSQAKPDRTTPGSGLGLSIVSSIVERHGGEVHLTSAPGEGTQVTLRLPAS